MSRVNIQYLNFIGRISYNKVVNLHYFILFNHGISKEDWIKNHIGASQVKQPLK